MFSSMFLYEYDIDSIARAVEVAGYDGLEFWVETPHFWIDRREEKLEPLKKMSLAVHNAVLDLNPVSVNPGVCELTLIETLYSINLASMLRASPVTVHAGKRSAAREPVWADYASMNKYLRICSKYSRIKKVRLCIENSEPGINYLCKTPEEITQVVEEHGLGFTFDINHATKNRTVEPLKFLELFEKIENVHVSGFDENGRHISALNSPVVRDILIELKELGYDGKITVELDDLGYGRMSFKDKVSVLEKEADFLRSIFKN